MSSVSKIHEGVTCLKGLEEDSVVVTGGRDGKVVITDLRTGGRVGEVRGGEFFLVLVLRELGEM